MSDIDQGNNLHIASWADDRAELTELRAIVRAVAESEGKFWKCPWCGCVMDDTAEPRHAPDCVVGRARKAVGLD